MLGNGDPYFEHIGPVWVRYEDTAATLLLRVERHHTNANGSTHGGVLMALIDAALALSLDHAIRLDDPAGHAHAITMQLSNSLIGAGALGDLLVVEGRLDRLTRSIGFASGRITAEDRLLMTATGVFKRPPLPSSSRPQARQIA